GHSYLMGVTEKSLPHVFEHKIIPLLTEYFFENWGKVRAVLADDQVVDKSAQFIVETDVDNNLFGNSKVKLKKVFRINKQAFLNPQAYQKVYASTGAPEAD
ncbi:MAG: hypothetical protein RLN96_13255, partial [Pseudomonadales bacterium]